MEKIKLSVETPKEITEIGIALEELLKSISVALADGFQPGLDVPVIVTSALANVATAIQGAEKIPEEFTGEPIESSLGALIPVARGINSFVKKKSEE